MKIDMSQSNTIMWDGQWLTDGHAAVNTEFFRLKEGVKLPAALRTPGLLAPGKPLQWKMKRIGELTVPGFAQSMLDQLQTLWAVKVFDLCDAHDNRFFGIYGDDDRAKYVSRLAPEYREVLNWLGLTFGWSEHFCALVALLEGRPVAIVAPVGTPLPVGGDSNNEADHLAFFHFWQGGTKASIEAIEKEGE